MNLEPLHLQRDILSETDIMIDPLSLREEYDIKPSNFQGIGFGFLVSTK